MAADVTGLLLRWSQGDAQALDQLLPLVYGECRRIAERQLRRERPDHTLSPTALVHELYLQLVDQRRATWQNRAHFFAVAAQLMRRILVDHARSRGAQKRGGRGAGGGRGVLVSLDADLEAAQPSRAAEVLALNDALDRLAARDPEQQRIVELRFFAGLTVEEVAHVVGRSPRTVKREWQLAKAWLFRELHPELAR
ncbi:MAG TPA: sigma-70 family RNA polymerase sigma factor [Gemmatimonadales bacterium]|jgi:RNA polymerase sigma factor (TIGR02999 family)|nr:sigma-70 family RNA polymerase sigma factor [Gemmatimonadales bacterium]